MNLGLNRPGCGISDSVQSWMDQIQHSGEKDPVAADSKGDEQEEKDSNKNDDKGELTEKCNHKYTNPCSHSNPFQKPQ